MLKKAKTKAKERLDEHIQQQNDRYQAQLAPSQYPTQQYQQTPAQNAFRTVHTAFSDFQIPRQVSPQNPWGLCEPCSVFGSWISGCLQIGNWQPFIDQSLAKPHQFKLGFLDQLLVTQDCRLCRLLKLALFNKFPEMHLTYHRLDGGGLAREEVILDCSSLFYDHNLVIELSVIFVNHEERRDVRLGSGATTEFGTGIRIVDADAYRVPAASSVPPCTRVGKLVPAGSCDFERFVEIYQHCLHQHGNICETPLHQTIDISGGSPKGVPPISGLRVIDVQVMRVIEAPSNCRFVALSYVWGQTKYLLLDKSNLQSLGQLQSLEHQDVPGTIEMP